jgi:hypothetical protein
MQEVTPHYEAGSGIRPPRKSGKFRGVAREIVVGGGMELWACDHNHAPGIHDVRLAAPEQQAAATTCAEQWLTGQISEGNLFPMPIERD